MENEKLEVANKMAAEMSNTILSECDPEHQGVVVSLIMKNIHTTHRTRIAESEQTHLSHTSEYTEFLKNIDLPQIEQIKK